MKKLVVLILVAFAALLFAGQASAQHNYGVIGGVTFNHEAMTQYHAGITYRAKLPMGFSVQPSLQYQDKGDVGYLELPVSFQWGPDLILFRPFLDVTPFVGYGLNNEFWSQPSGAWSGLNRWEYGLGAGLGLDIWKFQLIARYNWNFTNYGGVTLSLALLF